MSQFDSKLEKLIDILIFASIAIIYLSIFDFRLAFTNTDVAGGDMISHPLIVHSLLENIKNGHFWSWNSSWFAGFPFLYFYFYPVYIFVVILALLGLPMAVAFKCGVLAVVLSVPTVYYLCSRKVLTTPFATLFTAMGVFIFLNEFDSRWGGNFKSLLAGQVSHQFGLVMWVSFTLSLIAGQSRSLWSWLTFSLAILSHVYSGLFAGLVLMFYILVRLINRDSIKPLLKDLLPHVLAVLCTSFFWIPFLYYRNNTVAPINSSIVDWAEVIRVLQLGNSVYVVMYAAAIVLSVVTVIQKRNITFSFALLILAVLTSLSMPYLTGTPILHIRLPAEIYLLFLLSIAASLKTLKIKDAFQWGLAGPIAVILLQMVVPSPTFDKIIPSSIRMPVSDIPHWWKWNMSGIQEKPENENVLNIWKELKNISDADGRVAVEYGDYNKYGSPRIFEMTPVFTGKPIMEGLLLESSPIYPTYFYISFYFNTETWWPGFPVTVPERSVETGIKYFSNYNVKYFVAAREQTKKDFEKLKYKPTYKNTEFSLYEVNKTTAIANRIVGDVPVVESRKPLMFTLLNHPQSLDVFYKIQKSANEGKIENSKIEQSLEPLQGSWSPDKQSYDVMDTGASSEHPVKVLFKIPYFPNWKTNTGEAVELVTSNLMMVETKSSTLSLTYRAGAIEKLSAMLSGVALLMVAYLWRRRYFHQGA